MSQSTRDDLLLEHAAEEAPQGRRETTDFQDVELIRQQTLELEHDISIAESTRDGLNEQVSGRRDKRPQLESDAAKRPEHDEATDAPAEKGDSKSGPGDGREDVAQLNKQRLSLEQEIAIAGETYHGVLQKVSACTKRLTSLSAEMEQKQKLRDEIQAETEQAQEKLELAQTELNDLRMKLRVVRAVVQARNKEKAPPQEPAESTRDPTRLKPPKFMTPEAQAKVRTVTPAMAKRS
jgi:chromosome segregation ATPase